MDQAIGVASVKRGKLIRSEQQCEWKRIKHGFAAPPAARVHQVRTAQDGSLPPRKNSTSTVFSGQIATRSRDAPASHRKRSIDGFTTKPKSSSPSIGPGRKRKEGWSCLC